MAFPTRTAAVSTATILRHARPSTSSVVMPCHATQVRRQHVSMSKINRFLGARSPGSKRAQKQSISGAQRDAAMTTFKDGEGPFFNSTFIPLPLRKIPLRVLPRYQWWRLKYWVMTRMQLLQHKFQSMPTWRSRPRYRASVASIAPTARLLHREMLAALASGDRRALARVCTARHAARLGEVLDRRPPAQEVRLDPPPRDTRRPWYPRLVSFRVEAANLFDPGQFTEQAVVALSSRQRLARHVRATGELVPGSERVQDRVEYVVLSRVFRDREYVHSPWKIWGTAQATQPKGWLREMAAVNREIVHNTGIGPKPKTSAAAKGS